LARVARGVIARSRGAITRNGAGFTDIREDGIGWFPIFSGASVARKWRKRWCAEENGNGELFAVVGAGQ